MYGWTAHRGSRQTGRRVGSNDSLLRRPRPAPHELRFIRKAQALGFSLDEIDSVDGRIRQLQKFRRQLAGELAKWDRQQTRATCDGLCQFIADAELDMSPDDVNRHLAPR